ncbi:hypothetical protein TIFTF001_031856 [Ficus carica]|uniref:Uncharacterized protein n=1 Tax=Ficus carica TaxID=3494 RepID=A0AA88DVV2_FICCA|nr:hypothetical protein TIFTF001_031856 [Ficus carica]
MFIVPGGMGLSSGGDSLGDEHRAVVSAPWCGQQLHRSHGAVSGGPHPLRTAMWLLRQLLTVFRHGCSVNLRCVTAKGPMSEPKYLSLGMRIKQSVDHGSSFTASPTVMVT